MKAKPKKSAISNAVEDLVTEYRILVGQTIEALESYDADDGHNYLVMAGIAAEAKRLEDAWATVRARPTRKARTTT